VSSISRRKNQPSPSASELTSVGSSMISELVSTTLPVSGAKMSEAAFTLSTTAQASPAITSRLSSGSSTNTTSPNCSCAWSVMPTVTMSPSSTTHSCSLV